MQPGTEEPEVSLFIPTWNAGPEFPENLRRMLAQELDRPFEVIVIDSGSSDGTVEFLESQPVQLHRIPNREFDHGLTRNRGIELARGSIVVFATQDARPADGAWMQRLVDTFEDPEVAGVFGRQLPREDASPIVRYRLQLWVAGTEEPVVQQVASPAEFEALEPIERLQVAAFDNVSSAVRRSVMLEHPLQKRKFGEDIDWSKRVILAGYKLVYEPRSRVIHSHNYSAWRVLKRIYGDHSNLHDLLGVHTIKTWDEVRRFSRQQGLRYLAFVEEDPALGRVGRALWRVRARLHAAAEVLGQFLGGRAAERIEAGDSRYRLLDRVLRRGV